jgi:hypothetical protein
MGKSKEITAITQSAGLAARAMARLEASAAEVHADETAQRERSLQMASYGFHAVIRHGKTMVEISGDDFAVSRSE